MFKKISSFVGMILAVIPLIIFSPFIIVVALISLVLLPSVEKEFKFLKKSGYTYIRSNPYRYYTKGDVTFKFRENISYMVKFGESEYINLHETNFGLATERQKLEEDLMKYQSAHPVDKQRGEVDAITSFANYVLQYLEKIENFKTDK